MGKKAKKTQDAQQGEALKVCGPTLIRTLRGSLLGRDVALVCIGEAHEEAIDLTRANCVPESEEGWLEIPFLDRAGFDPEDAMASQGGLTLQGAKSWAERVLDRAAEDSDDDEEPGGVLVFEPGGLGGAKAKGNATLYPMDAEHSEAHPHGHGAKVFQWADLDDQAREFNSRRLKGEHVPTEEHDALITERKRARFAEGIEFLDDWIIRQACSSGVRTELILESPVPADQVELHVEGGLAAVPKAHRCFRQIELDSDADSDDEDDPDDGTGAYADFLQRRVAAHLRAGHIHGVDPRDLGDATDEAMRQAFLGLLPGPPPADVEEEELNSLGAKPAVSEESKEAEGPRKSAWKEDRWQGLPPVPSWEAYFGAAAELLYYSPQVKADYAPFLARCVGSPAALMKFFEALYFKTVPEALAEVKVDESTRSLTYLRSLAFESQAGAPLLRRADFRSKIPVRVAPMDRYLKARGSQPPRTWVSGLADRVRRAGGGSVVDAAQAWFRDSVAYLLNDPKDADQEGDYFAAWLRAVHRDIWDDIDRSDPEELRRRAWAASMKAPKSKKARHKIGEIRIPGVEEAFKELASFSPDSRTTTGRERVLAKIMVDAFNLRLTDLAMVLKVADVAASAPAGDKVVVMVYAGEDHSVRVAEFWSQLGFGTAGLPDKGVVGKRDWEDDEPRGLRFPPYLQDIKQMFPVPQ